ncbi:hypothetical protein [Streptomyces sp. NPDC051546]|uniref:hypothetical protein n=1 Tax=Streptomyces sp. NPDC051546 TaxID=3365655 RepID=UPI0037B0F1DD
MRTTMPETGTILRIGGTPALAPRTRLDLSAELGLDVDLFLGPVGGDDDELDEYTRLCALADMADAAFIPSGADLDRVTLGLIAGLAEEIERQEREDNARGFERESFTRGWAA